VIFDFLSRFVSFTTYGDELVVLLTDTFLDAFCAVEFVFLLGADVTLHTALSGKETWSLRYRSTIAAALWLAFDQIADRSST
jgi:hypothetical protein